MLPAEVGQLCGVVEVHVGVRNPDARCLLQRFRLGHVPVADGSPTAPNATPTELRLNVELVMATALLGCLQGTHPAPVGVAAIANHPLTIVGASLGKAEWWDPLAAMAAVRPGVVTFEDHRIAVLQAGTQAGRTAVAVDGRAVHVGVFADPAGFEQRFIDTLNGRST